MEREISCGSAEDTTIQRTNVLNQFKVMPQLYPSLR
jgi:hypothetical protein